MNITRRGALALIAVGAVALGIALAVASASGTTPYRWKNCTHVHQKYRHGVGRLHAHDHTTGVPVTNFYRSTRLYNIAMSYNRGLDRDKDGIACEQH
jgi:Excalibur calcium-binding domain